MISNHRIWFDSHVKKLQNLTYFILLKYFLSYLDYFVYMFYVLSRNK